MMTLAWPLARRSEEFDRQRLVAIGDSSGNFFRFKNDVLSVLGLIVLELIFPFDRVSDFAIDKLALDPISGRYVERAEGNPFRR